MDRGGLQQRFTKGFFFGNYFYGVCAPALALEASLQQGLPLNVPTFYIALFAGTVWYYTKAYQTEERSVSANQRTRWYGANRNFVRRSQMLMLAATLLFVVQFAFSGFTLTQLDPVNVLLTAAAVLMSAFYYGFTYRGANRQGLRSLGFIKPFLIGFIWAVSVTIVPSMFAQARLHEHQTFTLVRLLLLIKNFMFISVLAIMFDIKDYASDANLHLKTFAVRLGLRKTLFRLIIPLLVLGWSSFFIFSISMHFSAARVLLNTLPFAAGIAAAYGLQSRRSIFYYLALIDGIMLLKALCGILGAVAF